MTLLHDQLRELECRVAQTEAKLEARVDGPLVEPLVIYR